MGDIAGNPDPNAKTRDLLFSILQAQGGELLKLPREYITYTDRDLLWSILRSGSIGGGSSGGGGPTVWGTIIGTLSDQADLAAALASLSGGTIVHQTFNGTTSANAGANVIDYTGGAIGGPRITLTLRPAAEFAAGKTILITDKSGGISPVGQIRLIADAADNIQAQAYFDIRVQFGSILIKSDGANTWSVVGGNVYMQPSHDAGSNINFGREQNMTFYGTGAILASELISATRFRVTAAGTHVCFSQATNKVAKLEDSAGDGISLQFGNCGSVPTPGSGDSAMVGAEDVGGTTEMFVVDESGNKTQISPHNHTAPASLVDTPFDDVGWEANFFVGLVRYTNRTRLAKGRPDFLFVETFAQHNARLGKNLVQLDWNTIEQQKVQKALAVHAAWVARKAAWEAIPDNANTPFPEPEPPATYTPKPVPSWLTNQLAGKAAFVTANAAIHAASAANATKRTALRNSIATLRTWATEAANAASNWGTRTQVQKDAIHVATFNRLSTFMDRFADLLESQGVGE